MVASAPAVVMAAAAVVAHMAVTMAMAAAGKDDLAIGIAHQDVGGRARHRRGGERRQGRECAGGDADQQETFHVGILLGRPRGRGIRRMF